LRGKFFYPDLPKGYQISQFDEPFAERGWIEIAVEGNKKRIGLTRIHLEEDAGKSIRDDFRDSELYSYVDLNRSGRPLIEIVSDPVLRSSKEAYAFLTDLKLVLQYVGVSDCDMEKGQLRCDANVANVSVRPRGTGKFGTKAEVKNLNSFRFAKMALDYEIARQVAVLEGGGQVAQETRLYNAATGETETMRSKKDAHDYRYFPEPDLEPLQVSEEWVERLRESMPELPSDKRVRFLKQGLNEYQTQLLTATRRLSEYFETAAGVSDDPITTANWIIGELTRMTNGVDKITPRAIGTLVRKVNEGEISGKMAKGILVKMYAAGQPPEEIIGRERLRQISDAGTLGMIVDEVIAGNPKQVEQYKTGTTSVLGFLVGQVMKVSNGQANPAVVNELLRDKLT